MILLSAVERACKIRVEKSSLDVGSKVALVISARTV